MIRITGIMIDGSDVTIEREPIVGLKIFEHRMRFIALAVAVVLAASLTNSAQTWRLDKGKDWEAVQAEGKDKFLLAVAEAKKLVNTGQAKAARKAFDTLKKDFPEIAGPDLNLFIKAEMLFCKGQFSPSANSYNRLLTKYPKSEFRQAAFERQFAIATAFLAGQKETTLIFFKTTRYTEGLKIMERLGDMAVDSPIGAKAAMKAAESYEKQDKITLAVRNYDKLLTKYPTSDLHQEALDREFAIGSDFLGGKKRTVLGVFKIKRYAEGVRIMEKITDHAGIETSIGTNASIMVAEHYEKRSKFNEAYLKWREISSQWQIGQIGKDSLLGMARCIYAVYNKNPEHKRAFYDASGLRTAKTCYLRFKLLYPKDAQEIGAEEILKEIDEQLAQKNYIIGRYYQRTDKRQAANLYYDMVIKDFPDSKAAEMAKQMLFENSSSEKTKNEQ